MKSLGIKLADPCLTESAMEIASSVIRSGWLVNGPKAREFEALLSETCRRGHVIAVSSGTMALVATMKALGIGPGSQVLVPGLTFPAPAAAAAFLGATVRSVDVERKSFNLSPETVGPRLDSNVSLIVAVDQFGLPAPVPEIERLGAERGIPVLVDAACSLGSTLDGRPCGSFGVASIFSFHPRKVLTTGEGGVILTDDDSLAREIRRFINHGIEDGEFTGLGLNLRMGELNAAIGLTQLAALEETITRRRVLAEGYRKLPLQFQTTSDKVRHNFQTMAALLPEPMNRAQRDDLIAFLAERKIEASIASYCLEAVPTIAKTLGLPENRTPNARDIHERGIALPLHLGLTQSHVDQVVACVSEWLETQGALSG